DTERRCLQERLTVPCPVTVASTAKWALIWFVLLLFLGTLAAGVVALQAPHPVLGGIGGGILFTAAVVCLYGLIAVITSFVHWRRVYRDVTKETARAICMILEDGRVLSKEVTASEVYEIEEYEDEGPGYIFDVGGGTSLLLKGQKYEPEEDEMPWPASSFSLVRSVEGTLWVGLFSTGQTLCPSRKFKMEDCTDTFAWSEREEVLNSTPEEVLMGLIKSDVAVHPSEVKTDLPPANGPKQ
ncbi:MAG: hypothetical protein ACYC1V_32560, partial [Pirellulaceae bacterium]